MNKKRILAVDDNAVNLATLEQELQNRYEVIAMNSGSRAIKYLCRESVDLILLDVQMPIMDGIDTLHEIRSLKNGANVPVIFLTSSKERSTVMGGMKLGIVDYVIKPFQSKDLHERIARALKNQGAMPLEDKELYVHMKDMATEVQTGKYQQALARVDDILGYELDEDVAGRLKVIKAKLDSGDAEVAAQTIVRVIQLLEKRGCSTVNEDLHSIGRVELEVRLRYIIQALENFQTKDATEKVTALLQYKLPATCRAKCEKALTCLRDYNDVEAEKLLQTAWEWI
jgi:DNA-binding response OmpR family regulator